MHNRIGFNRLSRKPSHRKALHKNMVTSLLKHEKIKTTKAKAKEIRRTAEKLVTRAKVDSVHNRRIASRLISDKEILNKLFTEISPRYNERPGGYTRILKMGYRNGDAAELVVLEFVRDEDAKSGGKRTKKKKTAVATDSKKKAKANELDSTAVKTEENLKAEEVKEEKAIADNQPEPESVEEKEQE